MNWHLSLSFNFTFSLNTSLNKEEKQTDKKTRNSSEDPVPYKGSALLTQKTKMVISMDTTNIIREPSQLQSTIIHNL